MKTALLVLILSAATVFGEDPSQGFGDRYNTLVSGPRGANPSSLQYDAYHGLVAAGEEGWHFIFRAHFNLDPSGDVTRQIGSFWESGGIPDDVVTRFYAAMTAEVRKQSANETWALLYAAKNLDAQARVRRRYEPEKKALEGLFTKLSQDAADPAKALPSVALLRVRLVSRADFPGHRFPWTAAAEQQKKELQVLLEWWKTHASDFNEEG